MFRFQHLAKLPRAVGPRFAVSSASRWNFHRYASHAKEENVNVTVEPWMLGPKVDLWQEMDHLTKQIERGEHYVSYTQIKKRLEALPEAERKEIFAAYESNNFSHLLKGSGLENDTEFQKEISKLETAVRAYKDNYAKMLTNLNQEAKISSTDLDFDHYYKTYPQYRYVFDYIKEKYEVALQVGKQPILRIDRIGVWNAFAKDVADLKVEIKNTLEKNRELFLSTEEEIKKTEKEIAGLLEETVEESIKQYPGLEKEIEQDVIEGRWDAEEYVNDDGETIPRQAGGHGHGHH